jgi:hypothetical protein
MRTLQEMMGHRDFKTTLIYADYSPSAHDAEWIEAAFRATDGRPAGSFRDVRPDVTAPSPAIVAFIRHAERRALERGLALDHLAELVLTHHDRRLRNPGDADWIIHAGGTAIVYDWPDGDDSTTALVISAWRE